MHDPHCIFCKIIAGQIPSNKVYEDDELYAFHDINPGRRCISCWCPSSTSAPWPMSSRSTRPRWPHDGPGTLLALEQGCRPYPEGGFRVVVNTGEEGGQEVHHLHVHVMGGPRPWARG